MSLRDGTAIAALVIAMAAGSASHAASIADWSHDIDEITHDLETVHPNAFTKIDRAAFLAQAEALKSALPSLSEEQRTVRAMELVALVGDGHTQLAPNRPDFAYWYPVRIYEFTDGYFVTSAYGADSDLAGAQIMEVAGQPVAKVIGEVRRLMGSDNALDTKEHLFAFHNASLMKGLGYADSNGTLAVKFRLKDGRVVSRNLTPHKTDDVRYKENDATLDWRFSSEVFGPPIGSLDKWTSAYDALPALAYRTIDNTRPPHFTFRRPFVARALPDRDAYYIQANSVGDWGDKSFDEFFRNALSEVDKQKPNSLIVDLRYNSGGDGSKVPAVIHEFIKREDAPPWKHLYILTGRKTFSAAIMFLAAFIDHTRCTIIGEPAGAPLDSYGDPTTIDLSRSGVELDVSTLWHQLEDQGARYPVMPVDVPAPFSFADYAAGRDPAVDAILNGEEMRSLPIIAVEDGGEKMRKVFDQRQAKFAGYADWMRTREIDLIHAFWKLDDEKRPADALEVAKVEAALYPNSARAWGYLGDGQIATGQKQQRLKSYERALALDPNNLANLDERHALAETGFTKPDVIRYGANVAQLQTALGNLCKTLNTRKIDPPFLNGIKDRQMQIECEGFDFQGNARHAEFVFGDDSLKMAWIMVTPGEIGAMRDAMGAAYGTPTRQNAHYIAFTSNGAALRLDKAEVLFYGPDAASDVEPDFAAK